MALSGSFNTNAYNGRYLTFAWTATQSVSGNSSTISWTLKCAGTGSGYYKSGPFKVVIAGATVYTSNTRIELRIGDTVASGTKTITHNSDGTKSFSASAEAAIYTAAVNCTGSGTFTLNTIPRASSVSQAAAYIGDWANCVVSAASTAFTHDLTATFGDVTVTIGSGVAGGTTQWILPNSFYNVIPNATSGTGTITCKTYSGSTLIGTSTCSFTVMTKEADCKPTLNPEVQESNDEMYALTGSYSKLVKYYSSAFYLCGASAKNGASIVSYKVVNNGVTMTTSSGTFTDIESGTFTFTVTDSRGYSASATVTLTMVDYVKLTSNIQKANPTTSGDFTLTVTGNYFNGSFGSTSNNLVVYYRYKTGDGNYGSWTSMSISKSGNSYTATATFSGLDYQATYTFQSYASDSITSTTPVTLVTKSLPVFDWSGEDFNFNVPVNFSKGATGISGGGGGGLLYGTCSTSGSTSTKVVVCDDFTTLETGACIRVKFTNGNTATSPYLNVNGTGAKYIKKYGTTGSMAYMWYSGEVVDFVYDGTYWMMVDGGVATTSYYGATKLQNTIGTSTSTAVTPNAVYQHVNYGTWTPTCSCISSPAKAYGHYIRVGNMVVINWYLQGTVDTVASYVSIGGVPFTPDSTINWQAGGGNCTNGYTAAYHSFCGWNLEASGNIFARTAATSSAAGVRTASYVTAPSAINGKSMHLSGTLMYMTTEYA